MKALIDGIVFQNRSQRGIQRYFREVLCRIGDDENINCCIFMDGPVAVPLTMQHKVIHRNEFFPVSQSNLAGRVIRKSKKICRPTRLPGAHLFHSTYFTRSPVKGLPEVLTIHDMVPETVPHYFFGNADLEISKKRDCIEAASAIITVSESTREDLIRIYPEVADRATVIHHGAEHLTLDSSHVDASALYIQKPYILFVGDRAGYKNFSIMMDAVRDPDWPPDHRLVVVGRPFSEAEKIAVRFRGVEKQIEHAGRVSDADLSAIYRGSSGFVFPSLAEGFGFPILEAQGLGVPVAASDISVFHEVGGDAFVPFPPLDSNKLAQAVARLIEPPTRALLQQKGIENVKRFSWDRCAEETRTIWRSIASSN